MDDERTPKHVAHVVSNDSIKHGFRRNCVRRESHLIAELTALPTAAELNWTQL